MLREKRDRLRELSKEMKSNEVVLSQDDQDKAKAVAIDRMIASYKFAPHTEDPRYTTANNDIGSKRPTIATYVTERYFKTQAFSNSFTTTKSENSSLNTGLTRSTVHPKLDPQFI